MKRDKNFDTILAIMENDLSTVCNRCTHFEYECGDRFTPDECWCELDMENFQLAEGCYEFKERKGNPFNEYE